MQNLLKSRRNLLTILFLLILLLFIGRMLQMQLIQGDDYEAKIYKGTVKTQIIPAARGEILDRYGNPLVVNRVSFDISLDRTFLPVEEQNTTILTLMELLRSTGEEWIDNLPITQEQPYEFLEGRTAAVERLKQYVQVNSYADAEEVMHWLVEKYKLQEYSQPQQRALAGVLYEMNQKGFNYSTPYIFARDISVETTTRIKESNLATPGVDVVQSVVRDYPDNGSIAPHILGLTGPIWPEELEKLGEEYHLDDTIGKSGIEKAFESKLRGVEGERRIYINQNGEVTGVVESKPPQAGSNVMLTIDSRLQRVAQEALERQILNLQKTAPEGKGREAFAGAVAAVDVKTGEVLALANYPSYDLATYQENYDALVSDQVGSPLMNRALQGTYTPGSIFKPVVALAGLDTGEIDGDSKVYCGHVYTYYDDYQPTCLGNHQNIDVATALKYSCNIFFYDVGRRVGIDSINEHAQALGLGVDLGFELSTPKGQLSTRERAEQVGEQWSGGDVLQSAIGQRFNKYSPLQLAVYASTIANRGVRMDSTILKGIKDYSMQKDLYQHRPEVASDMQISPQTFDPIFNGMIAASRTGTASQYFGSYRMDVASKTGTPETKELPNSTFIAFAPAQDPQIAVCVIIEKGWHGYTGAPVAREIFDAYFSSDVTGQEKQQAGVLLP